MPVSPIPESHWSNEDPEAHYESPAIPWNPLPHNYHVQLNGLIKRKICATTLNLVQCRRGGAE